MATRKSARKTVARKNNTSTTSVSKRKHQVMLAASAIAVDDEPQPTCGAQLPGHPWFCSLAPGHQDAHDEPSEHRAFIVDDAVTEGLGADERLAMFWMNGASSYRTEIVDGVA